MKQKLDPPPLPPSLPPPPFPQQRQQAFANFREYIGADITSLVTLPVWIMEPYTLLQKVGPVWGGQDPKIDTRKL